jgi:VanZ family protein
MSPLKTRRFIFEWVPVLLWAAIIFWASGDRMSFQHSSNIIGPFLHWLFPQMPGEHVHAVVVFVRKLAHVSEYAVLTYLIWRLVRSYRSRDNSENICKEMRITLLVVIMYAASDEFHQHFVPTREASVRDVLIDTSGAILALTALWFKSHWRPQRLATAQREVPSEV